MSLEGLVGSLEPTSRRPIVVVTGAGMSVASGIPTFRGPEGYWTVGAKEYHPQELATLAAFRAMPREVWRWYLYRRAVCNRAEPNPAHRAVADLERAYGDGMAVVTQNVDGLHVRGGTSLERTFEVHGSIDWMRDLKTDVRVPIPDGLGVEDKEAPLTDAQWEQLVNPATGERCRPHVLWFDEYYDEVNYRMHSAMAAAASACLLVVCGTSGAAAAPFRAVELAMHAGAALIDISPDDNPFREVADGYERGLSLHATAVEGFAQLNAALGIH